VLGEKFALQSGVEALLGQRRASAAHRLAQPGGGAELGERLTGLLLWSVGTSKILRVDAGDFPA
jgi:hypothetical protein